MQRSPALSPQCFFLPQSCRRSPLAVVLSPQSCRRSALVLILIIIRLFSTSILLITIHHLPASGRPSSRTGRGIRRQSACVRRGARETVLPELLLLLLLLPE